ncbi:MAG: shikimate kinase [Oscillospiraceae bacterium]
MKNIVLIGMPGSGKSTVGALLSRRLSRPFADLDTLIEETASLTVSEIFAQWGEGAFRDLESALTAQTARDSGQIIATGGGVILREENMTALRKNGLIFFLDRPPDALKRLAHKGRPLIAGDLSRVDVLYTERIDLYRHYAQYSIDGSGTPSDVVAQILAILQKTEGNP